MDCHFLLQGSSRPRDQTHVSRIAGRHFTILATREVAKSWTQLRELKSKTKSPGGCLKTPQSHMEGTTEIVVRLLLRHPSYESEETGPDLTCILPALAAACGIIKEVEDTLTSSELGAWFSRLPDLWAAWASLQPCFLYYLKTSLLENHLINSFRPLFVLGILYNMGVGSACKVSSKSNIPSPLSPNWVLTLVLICRCWMTKCPWEILYHELHWCEIHRTWPVASALP